MLRVSSDLYGSNVAFSHELAKDYTHPVLHDAPRLLPNDTQDL